MLRNPLKRMQYTHGKKKKSMPKKCWTPKKIKTNHNTKKATAIP